MKFSKITYSLLIILLLISCKKDLTELNINPNDPTSTNPNYLFTYALQQGMGNYNSDVNLEQWALMNWTMFMAARGGVEPGKEYVIPSGKDAFWNEQYSQSISNTQEIINMADENPDWVNLKAAALIWKVNLFHKITDLWGHIPYSDAVKGISDLNYSPYYDEQEDVYIQMLEDLEYAVQMFTSDQIFFTPDADLIYQGNKDNWIAFGNALRLRLATRINRVDPEKYQEIIDDLKDQPMISSNEESAIFPFNSLAKNHLYDVMLRGEAIVQNNPAKFMVDLLVNSNDPRVSIFLEKAPLSFLPIYPEYNGVPNLLNTNDPIWENYNPDGEWGDISRIGNWFLRNETPGVISSYAEVCFLKAEAALNGAWPADVNQLVEDGIRSNALFFNNYGDGTDTISTTDLDAYLASLPDADLEQIITQKWITFIFENGYEAYSEYRRTGFPILKDYHGEAINQDIFPVRLIYPYSEYTLNREHYNEAVNTQGQDNEYTNIWWDD